MDPSTPPAAQDLYCYDCGSKLTATEAWEFRPNHDPHDTERENCRRLMDDDESIFVPLCDKCYLYEEEEEDSGNTEQQSDSSYSCYCQGCGEEIDWDITKEEFENDTELHLCTRCQAEEDN